MRMLFSLVLVLGFASAAAAHEPRKGPHGGALVDAGHYHVEVVANDTVLDVFLSDMADKPLKAAGFKGLAILAVDGKSARVALDATADGEKLEGSAPAGLGQHVKGVVQLTAPDGKTATAKLN